MEKLVLLSIVAITVVVPAAAAAERNSRLGLRKTLAWMLIGVFGYLVSVLFVYPRLLG